MLREATVVIRQLALPPYSSGMDNPSKPISPIFFHKMGSQVPFKSLSSALRRITLLQKILHFP